MIDLSYLVTMILSAVAAGWYCYRWGHDDGQAEGHADGYARGLLSDKRATDAAGIGSGVRNQAMTGGPMQDGGVRVNPQGGGGPGRPEK